MNHPSLLSFILDAGFVVKCVMLILFAASICSWVIIFQRTLLFKHSSQNAKRFEKRFWSGVDLAQLFQTVGQKSKILSGLPAIFHAGFNEFTRLRKQTGTGPSAVMEGSQRAMRVATAREIDSFDRHVSFFATVGSTSPYGGLVGTVWGILTSFQALGTVQQATIGMVAPGISEALIATAIGLFAAIPAVIAYNRLSTSLDRLTNHYDTFQEEFTSILHRQAHSDATLTE
jgi:biopolymer transport protein TolQ